MVGQCGSDVGGETVVAAPTAADLLQVVDDTGKNSTTSRVLVDGFAVREPPVDAEAAAERADDIVALLAAFGNHLHEIGRASCRERV